jgi:hypothetical protein
MNNLYEQHIHEQLRRTGNSREQRGRAPGDEGPRRPLIRTLARYAGRGLVSLGLRLLALGGESPRTQILVVPGLGASNYLRN